VGYRLRTGEQQNVLPLLNLRGIAMIRQQIAFCLALGLLVIGCAMPQTGDTRDPISAGSAKLFLKKGETTQAEVLEAFGGPNIVAGDADGNETWTYDRMSYVSSSMAGGGAAAGAGVIGSVPTGGLVWGQASKAASGSRTVTLFLYWKDGVLADYKYRSASF
jgi:hypothetical protein